MRVDLWLFTKWSPQLRDDENTIYPSSPKMPLCLFVIPVFCPYLIHLQPLICFLFYRVVGTFQNFIQMALSSMHVFVWLHLLNIIILRFIYAFTCTYSSLLLRLLSSISLYSCSTIVHPFLLLRTFRLFLFFDYQRENSYKHSCWHVQTCFHSLG